MRLTEEQKHEIRELYQTNKYTQMQLAKMYNVSHNQIRGALSPKIPNKYDRRFKLTDEQKQEIVDKYGTGKYSYNQLAEMYNVSKSTIKFIIHPEYLEKSRKNRMNKYDRQKAKEYMASHRAYKRLLIQNEKI